MWGIREDNNDSPEELVEQAPPEPPAPPIEPELRRSTREQWPSTKYPPYEYVMLIDGGELEYFEEPISYQHKNERVKAM